MTIGLRVAIEGPDAEVDERVDRLGLTVSAGV